MDSKPNKPLPKMTLDAVKAKWLSMLDRYIEAAGENSMEEKQLSMLRKLVKGVDTERLNEAGHAETEFKIAIHRAIEASKPVKGFDIVTELYNALRVVSFYNKHPPEPLEVRIARAKASHEAEQAAKAAAEKAKSGRIYLSVPYDQKDKAKATADKAGTRIRFDGDKKKWYWEGDGELPGALARWKS